MGLGRVLLIARQTAKEGWTTPYYRSQLRPKIEQTRPFPVDKEGTVGVHCLTGQQDLWNLLWTLKTFYWCSHVTFPLTVHDDGSLTEDDWNLLQRHFPGMVAVPRREGNAAAEQALAQLPLCRQYRDTHALALKAFDVGFFRRTPKVLFLDSDVLFFERPEQLLVACTDGGDARCVFNQDVAPGLNISIEDAEREFGIALLDRINSGLMLLPSSVFRCDWMEEFLAFPSLLAGKIWRVEQTLLALSACRVGATLLPDSYRVSLSAGTNGCVAKHYVGAVRHLMYREGMARLASEGFLRRIAG